MRWRLAHARYARSRRFRLLLGRLGLRGDFSCEVGLLLFDTLAYYIEHEACDRSVLRFEQLLDRELRVFHERLAEQRDFFQELLHAAFDHLLDDVGRLARSSALT